MLREITGAKLGICGKVSLQNILSYEQQTFIKRLLLLLNTYLNVEADSLLKTPNRTIQLIH